MERSNKALSVKGAGIRASIEDLRFEIPKLRALYEEIQHDERYVRLGISSPPLTEAMKPKPAFMRVTPPPPNTKAFTPLRQGLISYSKGFYNRSIPLEQIRNGNDIKDVSRPKIGQEDMDEMSRTVRNASVSRKSQQRRNDTKENLSQDLLHPLSRNDYNVENSNSPLHCHKRSIQGKRFSGISLGGEPLDEYQAKAPIDKKHLPITPSNRREDKGIGMDSTDAENKEPFGREGSHGNRRHHKNNYLGTDMHKTRQDDLCRFHDSIKKDTIDFVTTYDSFISEKEQQDSNQFFEPSAIRSSSGSVGRSPILSEESEVFRASTSTKESFIRINALDANSFILKKGFISDDCYETDKDNSAETGSSGQSQQSCALKNLKTIIQRRQKQCIPNVPSTNSKKCGIERNKNSKGETLKRGTNVSALKLTGPNPGKNTTDPEAATTNPTSAEYEGGLKLGRLSNGSKDRKAYIRKSLEHKSQSGFKSGVQKRRGSIPKSMDCSKQNSQSRGPPRSARIKSNMSREKCSCGPTEDVERTPKPFLKRRSKAVPIKNEIPDYSHVKSRTNCRLERKFIPQSKDDRSKILPKRLIFSSCDDDEMKVGQRKYCFDDERSNTKLRRKSHKTPLSLRRNLILGTNSKTIEQVRKLMQQSKSDDQKKNKAPTESKKNNLSNSKHFVGKNSVRQLDANQDENHESQCDIAGPFEVNTPGGSRFYYLPNLDQAQPRQGPRDTSDSLKIPTLENFTSLRGTGDLKNLEDPLAPIVQQLDELLKEVQESHQMSRNLKTNFI